MNGKTVFKSSITQNTDKFKTIFKTPTISSTTTTPVCDDDIFKVLADFSLTVDALLVDFSKGNFQAIAVILTRTQYNTWAVALNKLKQPQNVTFEQLRITIQDALQGLYQSVLQYGILINTTNQLEVQTTKANILNSIDTIKEYLKSIKKSVNIFPDAEITVVKALIRPEYAEYIKLYGYPPGGIFDMDKLAAIILDLDLGI